MADIKLGIYEKFTVTRNDGGSEPGEKHHGCNYFVLDLVHDPHAEAALMAYSISCRKEFPALSGDLELIAFKIRSNRLRQGVK